MARKSSGWTGTCFGLDQTVRPAKETRSKGYMMNEGAAQTVSPVPARIQPLSGISECSRGAPQAGTCCRRVALMVGSESERRLIPNRGWCNFARVVTFSNSPVKDYGSACML